MKDILNKTLLVILAVFTTACYTIVDMPTDYENNDIVNEINSNSSPADDYQQPEIVKLYNYSCNYGGSCCTHSHCHSFLQHHTYTCSGYCQLSFNWWSGTYNWNYYHGHSHHHRYQDAYYSGYYDGYYDGYWWSYNDTGISNNENLVSDYTQERRERSYSRNNMENHQTNQTIAVSQSGSLAAQDKSLGNRTNMYSYKNNDKKTNKNYSAQLNKGKSKGSHLISSMLGNLFYTSSSKKSSSKDYSSTKGSSKNNSSSKSYANNKNSKKNDKEKKSSSKSKRRNGRKRL